MIDDAMRIRVLRALLGATRRDMSARLEISQVTLTSWESGRTSPARKHRDALSRLCQQHRIGFLPSGMPVPFHDCLQFKSEKEEIPDA
jgi:DNA-binding XRE family transcriptional regulator